MRRSMSSGSRLIAASALLVTATAVVVVAHPSDVSAAPPAFTKIPTRLYMIPKEHSTVVPDVLAGLAIPIETMKFDDVPLGGDIISGDSRIIEVESSETASCRHHGTNADPDDPADDYDLTGCTALQLDVNNGTIKFDPAPVAEDDPALLDPQFQIYRFASGALLRQADSPDDLEGLSLALIGAAAEINQTIKTLVYTPTVDDPSTTDQDEDYYFNGSNPETLTVDLVPGDTSEGGTVTRFVDIKVLDYNDFPEVTVPQEQWSVASGADRELFVPTDPANPPSQPTAEVADEDNDEIIDGMQADPPEEPDPIDGKGQQFLVVAWATCGQFALRSETGFGIKDDLEAIFDEVWTRAQDSGGAPLPYKEQVRGAFFAMLPDDVENLPFATGLPDDMHTAFAGIANDIDWLNWSIGQITFRAEDELGVALPDSTCKLRVLVSDLGNNGLPIQYLGDPNFGVEIPMFGVDFDTNYVPAVEELTMTVGAGGPVERTINSVSNVTLAEGTGGTTTPFTFTLSLDGPAAGDEVVTVATLHGPAPASDDTDFTPIVNQTVTFPAGASSATFTVPVNHDATDEPDEQFTLTLSNPQNVMIGDPSGLGTIQNDDGADPPPQIDTFTDVTLAEGNSGATAFTFTIGLDEPAPASGVSVVVATQHVTTDGSDLTPIIGQVVSFMAGQDSRTITVNVNGDTDVEPTETFTATLSSPNGATIAPAAQSVTGTITADDFRSASINDVSVLEGDSGTTNLTFTVSLNGTAVGNESLLVSTGGGTATAGVDYTSLSNVPVTFAAGATSQTVTVEVQGDPDDENDETFVAVLTNPTNLSITDGFGTGTIQDDDDPAPLPTVSIADVTMAEGNAGTTAFTFTLSLDAPAPAGASVDVASAVGTADAADFTALTTTVPFTTGLQSATATVLVNGDTDVEGDDTFTLNLSNPQNVVIGDTSATGTIQNDDGAVADESVSIGDVSLAEGNLGATAFDFTLTLSDAAEGVEAVTATVTHGTTDATDLTLTSAPVTFANGALNATFSVAVNGDVTPELDETFTVTLSAPQGLLIGDLSATGTILNDDVAPDRQIISISNVALAEGDSGTTDFQFTVTLDGPAEGDETVQASTAHVSTDAVDLAPLTNTPVSFAQGATSANVTVAVSGETDVELDETFTLTLSNPENVTVAGGVGPATGTIQNDDGAQADAQIMSVSDVSLAEGNVGTTNFAFTLSLDQPADGDESVQISTSNTSTDNVDLTPLTNAPVTFAQGATSANVIVLINGDTDFELDETFTVTLSGPQNVTIAASAQSATGTIVNDDDDDNDSGGPVDPLTITAPADIVVPNDPGQAGAVVSYPAPTTTGGVAPVTISCTSQSGAFYPLGVTTVTCTATDSDPLQEGQAFPLAIVADSFTITVVQNQPPAIADNPDITRFTTDDGVVVVFSPPGATDDSGIPPTVTCNPPSGTLFTVGSHIVTCTATDSSGLQATSSFAITIDSSAQLPATGGDLRGLLLIAAGSVLLGVLLLRQRRRAHVG